MHLKRYRSETVKDALQAVREDLGPEALVLSTRSVTATGVRGLLGRREVEVTAAAERHEVPDERHQPARGAAAPSPFGAGEGVPRSLARAGKAARSERAAGEIAARLQASGLEASLAQAIAAQHPVNRRRGANLESLRETLATELRAMAAGEEPYAPIEVFVGPPGVGKTTTIAKIAAQERARHGQRLALLAADGFRVGAIEQLRLYADILGAPFAAARPPDELSRALDDITYPMLVDTAGRSPADEMSQDMFRVLTTRRDVRTHLVIPAATSRRAAERLFDRFADARPSRVILTRL